MDILDSLKRGELEVISGKIAAYLRSLPPSLLGMSRIDRVEVLTMFAGAYNLNYHVRANGKDFILRVNIDQQSGLRDQMDYEFQTLEFLQGREISPRPVYLDDTKQHFEFGIMIQEYLEGPYLTLEKEEMKEVANLLARLHALSPGTRRWIVWIEPLASTYRLARGDLEDYQLSPSADPEIVRLSERLLKAVEPQLGEHSHLFRPDGVNHTDLARDNFIKTDQGLRLIDWEKPRVDDSSYDVCCFLSEPAQLWCGPETLSSEAGEAFIRSYVASSGKDEGLLRRKIRLREPLVSLHWVLWGAIKLSDLRDGKTASALVQVHEEKMARYKRLARAENIAKLLEGL